MHVSLILQCTMTVSGIQFRYSDVSVELLRDIAVFRSEAGPCDCDSDVNA